MRFAEGKKRPWPAVKRVADGAAWLVDPDARRLKKHGQNVTGYNVQISVDSKHKLLVAGEATSDGNDSKQLEPQAKQAQSLLAVDHLNVVADMGYHSPTQLKACSEAGITTWVPEPPPRGPTGQPDRLSPGEFEYNAENNGYRCPQGEWLRHAVLARVMISKWRSTKAIPIIPGQTERRPKPVVDQAVKARYLERVSTPPEP